MYIQMLLLDLIKYLKKKRKKDKNSPVAFSGVIVTAFSVSAILDSGIRSTTCFSRPDFDGSPFVGAGGTVFIADTGVDFIKGAEKCHMK